MEVSIKALDALDTAIQTAFNTSLIGAETTYARIAMTVASTTAQEAYPKLQDLGGMREWIGERHVQRLEDDGFVIRNRPYENTISVPADRISDDQYGIYTPIVSELGKTAAELPDELCWEQLELGWSKEHYDGQLFFDVDHPVLDIDGKERSVSNSQGGSGAAWYLIDDTRAIKPIIFQDRQAATIIPKVSLSGVRSEIEGIMAAIASIGGGLVDRAAKNAELKALNAGATIAEAAARGQETRRNSQYNARKNALGGGLFGGAVAGVERWWGESGDALDASLSDARSEARRAESAARRKGGGGSSGLGAISSVKDEIARLKPSLDADIAAAEAWRDKALAALKSGKEGYAEYAADVEEIFQERLAEAYKADLERREDWAAGGARALIELEESMTSWADFTEDVVTNFAQSGEDAFARFVTTGKASLGDFVDFVAEAFARLAYQQMMMPALSMGLNAIIGAIAPGLVPAAAGAGAALPTNHTGSPGVVRSYAFAGYGDTPRPDERLTMMKQGEQMLTSRALENAGALISGLSAIAAQSSKPVELSAPVQIITNTARPLEVEERETTTPQGGRQRQFVLSDAVASGLRARGGAARQALSHDFGVQESGIRR